MEPRTCKGFQWDEGNAKKNWIKHRVSRTECEEFFFNRPLVVADDPQHSQTESRSYALGKTDNGRLLFVVFVIREEMIRVISARPMGQRERKAYKDVHAQTHPNV